GPAGGAGGGGGGGGAGLGSRTCRNNAPPLIRRVSKLAGIVHEALERTDIPMWICQHKLKLVPPQPTFAHFRHMLRTRRPALVFGSFAVASQLAFVDEHHGTARSACPVGEAEALVKVTGRKVWFVDANVHSVRAPLASLAESRLHKRSPQALPPPVRSDIQFGQVTLQASAPDGGTEAEHGQPVWPVPGKQDQRVTVLEKLPHPVCQFSWRRRRLIELPVEVVKQPPHRASIIKVGKADKVRHLSSHHGSCLHR